jgi:plasmid maintenance system antidote protein VapI
VPGPTPATHPGEILRMEFLVPLNLSTDTGAKQCRVPRTRIERLAREDRVGWSLSIASVSAALVASSPE